MLAGSRCPGSGSRRHSCSIAVVDSLQGCHTRLCLYLSSSTNEAEVEQGAAGFSFGRPTRQHDGGAADWRYQGEHDLLCQTVDTISARFTCTERKTIRDNFYRVAEWSLSQRNLFVPPDLPVYGAFSPKLPHHLQQESECE